MESSPARELLARIGISESSCESLRLGYAPNDWDYIVKKLQGHATAEVLSRAGLIVPRKSGSGYYDRFRSRLMIPIGTQQSLCGFVGVGIDGTEPVLLFSPDSQFFSRAVAVAFVRDEPELRAITGL